MEACLMTDIHTAAPFWFVWCPEGNSPRHKHPSEALAISEAERLARENPGRTFVVLESVCARRVDDMLRLNMRPERGFLF